MRKVYQGLLAHTSNSEETDLLGLDGEILVEKIVEDMWNHGEYLSVYYYISDQVASEEELQKAFLKHLMGCGDGKYAVHYSDLTGYLWTDEELNVGGHDLVAELKSHLGKYLHMVIEFSEEGKKE